MFGQTNDTIVQHIDVNFRRLLQDHSEQPEFESLFSLSPLSSADELDDDDELDVPMPATSSNLPNTSPSRHLPGHSEQPEYGPLFSLSPLSSEDELADDVEADVPSRTTAPILPHPAPSKSVQSFTPLTLTSNSTNDVGPSNPSISTSASKRNAKNKTKSHRNREKKRQLAKQSNYGYTKVKEVNFTRHVHHAHIVRSKLEVSSSNVVSTGYTGKDDKTRPDAQYTLEDLVGAESTFKFRLLPWDGKTTMPLVDKQGTIFGVCAGHPADQDWQSVCQAAADALETRRHRCRMPVRKGRKNRRGDFVNLSFGVSHGGGQEYPKNRSQSTHNAQVLEELNGMDCFKRLAGFGSNVMATWAPNLHDYCSNQLGKLFRRDGSLKRNFANSVFPAATYNMGPQISCLKHLDFANLAFGWCVITALGSYDPERGGHLVLWDCGLVIEFPPGSTILIPSTIIAHSNTTLMDGEKRYSFTQYAAGALFRWVENDFKKSEVQWAKLDIWGRTMSELRDKTRWRYGISLLSNIYDKRFEGAGSERVGM